MTISEKELDELLKLKKMEKKKNRFSKFIVTLVTAWFAFTTGELWFLASIRKKKMEGEHYE